MTHENLEQRLKTNYADDLNVTAQRRTQFLNYQLSSLIGVFEINDTRIGEHEVGVKGKAQAWKIDLKKQS